jgi:hypothetical protein
MKISFLTILFLLFISCKNVTEKKIQNIEIKTDSTELKTEKAEKQYENIKLNSFLENPIDLQEFKKTKNRNVTTTINNGLDYQYHPKINDSIFYGYNFITENIGEKGINEIIVFKFGENKHRYEDETEILIELRIFNKDSDLGKANLIGLSKTELESEFGTNYLTLQKRIVYSNRNKILIIELENSKVKSFNYIKLSTENIESGLVRKIVE